MIIGLISLLCSYLHICPDHAKFRNGPPPNLENQDVMFRKAHVTGQSAAIAGQEEGNCNEAPIMLDDDTSPSNNAIAKRKHVENEMGTGKRKHVEKDFFSSYNNALNTIVSRHTEGSSSSKDDQVPTMKEFLGMVRDCGVSEGTAIMYTAGKLAMNRDHREVFAAFATTAGRLDWLQRTHDEMNK